MQNNIGKSIAGEGEVKPDQYVTAKIDAMMAGEKALLFDYLSEVGFTKVWNPEKIVVVIDHRIPFPNVLAVTRDVKLREAVEKYGIKYWCDVERGGVCHQVFAEGGHALPGELVTGATSFFSECYCIFLVYLNV